VTCVERKEGFDTNLEHVIARAAEVASWPDTEPEAEPDDGLVQRAVETIVTRAQADLSGDSRSLLESLAEAVERRAQAQEVWDRSLAREQALADTRGQASGPVGLLIGLVAVGLLPVAGPDIIPFALLPNVKNLLAPLLARLTERSGTRCWALDREIRHCLNALASRVAPDTPWLDPPPS